MRGEQSVAAMAKAMLATLNKPKNAAKGPWDQMTLLKCRGLLEEERTEVDREILERHYHGGIDWERLADELVDEAICAMIMWELCQRKIAEG